MAREDVKVKPGYEYDHYFPRAKLITIVKKKGANVADTLLLIPAIIRETSFHTKRFAKEVIAAETLEQSCRNLWQFVYDYIAYKKDEDGKEQVRSPARTWHDRHNKDANGKPMGVDCDCMTVFVVSVLYNLGIKNIFFRITKYEEKHFEHIYPIIVLPNGKQITIDCVVHQFNYETPYTEKQDTAMDLEYLNGVKDSTNKKYADATDLMGIMDEHEALSALGKIIKRKSAGGGSGGGGGATPPKKKLFNFKKPPQQKEKRKAKIANTKKFLGKGLHVTNRINPVTVALRNGVLAGMKLNFLQLGSNLRWSYLSDADAAKKGILMDRFRKLKNVREKLEKIFFGAGGKPENLKKAILTGRGNKDKAVPLNGLGSLSFGNVDGLHEDMPLNQLLGQEIYRSENVEGLEGLEGLEGFGELGDLGSATAASVAAASSTLTAIAALIKNIGSIFPNKKAAGNSGGSKPNTGGGSGRRSRVQDTSSDNENNKPSGNTSSEANDDSGGGSNSDDSNSNSGSDPGGDPGGGSNSGGGDSDGGDSGSDSGSSENNNSGNSSNDDGNGDESTNGSKELAKSNSKEVTPSADSGEDKPSPAIIEKAKAFWENHKKLIKGTGIALGTVALIALAVKLLKPKKKKNVLDGIQKSAKAKPKVKPKGNVLSGIKHKKKGGPKVVKKHAKKKSIALF